MSTLVGAAHHFFTRVYYEDTDAAGIVYYANYLRFAERARTELLRLLGFEQEKLRASGGPVFAVRRCEVDFLAPARLDDELVVESRLLALGGASLDIDQRVKRGKADVARLFVRVACLNANGRPARLPRALRAALSRLVPTLEETDAR